jgi:FkbM family methyltransferase
MIPISVASPYQLIQARHGWMLVNSNDFYMGRALLEYGECCEIEGQFLVSLWSLRPGRIIEVGANVGIHTIPLAKALALEKREMVAFEPQPFVFQNLCANLALNGLTNITAWPWACGAKNEVVYFDLPDYNAQGNFGGISVASEAGAGSVAVPCVRLDDVVVSDEVGLLKVDVEGHELPTLQGAVGVLTRSRPLLYVENDRVEKSQALIEWLWSHNYQLFWYTPRLFNPDNFLKKETNIYDDTTSFNMVGLPRELRISTDGMQEIANASYHPLVK